jgi:hypothetical protein
MKELTQKPSMWHPGERTTAATEPGNRTNDIAGACGVVPCGFPDFFDPVSRASRRGTRVPESVHPAHRVFRRATRGRSADQRARRGSGARPAHRHDSRTIRERVLTRMADRARAQTRVAPSSRRGSRRPFRRVQDGKTKRKILGRENAPQVSRSYPNVARDRPRCRRGGWGGRPHAQGARTECHGERGARDPPFFPLETENSNNHWYAAKLTISSDRHCHRL